MKTQQLITGILIITLGAFLFYLAIKKTWIIFFYSIPLIIIGIVILLNKKEDIIEEIKKTKKNGKQK